MFYFTLEKNTAILTFKIIKNYSIIHIIYIFKNSESGLGPEDNDFCTAIITEKIFQNQHRVRYFLQRE